MSRSQYLNRSAGPYRSCFIAWAYSLSMVTWIYGFLDFSWFWFYSTTWNTDHATAINVWNRFPRHVKMMSKKKLSDDHIYTIYIPYIYHIYTIYNYVKINENQWNSMKINENQWKSMIFDDLLKFIEPNTPVDHVRLVQRLFYLGNERFGSVWDSLIEF